MSCVRRATRKKKKRRRGRRRRGTHTYTHMSKRIKKSGTRFAQAGDLGLEKQSLRQLSSYSHPWEARAQKKARYQSEDCSRRTSINERHQGGNLIFERQPTRITIAN